MFKSFIYMFVSVMSIFSSPSFRCQTVYVRITIAHNCSSLFLSLPLLLSVFLALPARYCCSRFGCWSSLFVPFGAFCPLVVVGLLLVLFCSAYSLLSLPAIVALVCRSSLFDPSGASSPAVVVCLLLDLKYSSTICAVSGFMICEL